MYLTGVWKGREVVRDRFEKYLQVDVEIIESEACCFAAFYGDSSTKTYKLAYNGFIEGAFSAWAETRRLNYD